MGHLSFKWDAKWPKELFGLQDILKLQKVIVPEMVELLEKRYNIKQVKEHQYVSLSPNIKLKFIPKKYLKKIQNFLLRQ